MIPLRNVSTHLGNCSRSFSTFKQVIENNVHKPDICQVSSEHSNIPVKTLREFYENGIQSRHFTSSRHVTDEDVEKSDCLYYPESCYTNLKVKSLRQLYEYGNLMRKELPAGLLEGSSSIRYYSKKGYPWNTVCKNAPGKLKEKSKCQNAKVSQPKDVCSSKPERTVKSKLCSKNSGEDCTSLYTSSECAEGGKCASKKERAEPYTSSKCRKDTEDVDSGKDCCSPYTSSQCTENTKCANEEERGEPSTPLKCRKDADNSKLGKDCASLYGSSQCAEDAKCATQEEHVEPSTSSKCKKDAGNVKCYGMSSGSSYRFTRKENESSEISKLSRCERFQVLNKKERTCSICLDKSFNDCKYEKPSHLTFIPIKACSSRQNSGCNDKKESTPSCTTNGESKAFCHTRFTGCRGGEQSGDSHGDCNERNDTCEAVCQEKKDRRQDSCEALCKKKSRNPCGGPDSVNRSQRAVRKVTSSRCGSRSSSKSSKSKIPCPKIKRPSKSHCGRIGARKTRSSKSTRTKSCLSRGIKIKKPKKRHSAQLGARNPCGAPRKRQKQKKRMGSSCKPRKSSSVCGKSKKTSNKCNKKPSCHKEILKSAKKRKVTKKKKIQAKVMNIYKRGPQRPKGEEDDRPCYPWGYVKVAKPWQAAEKKKGSGCGKATPTLKVKKKTTARSKCKKPALKIKRTVGKKCKKSSSHAKKKGSKLCFKARTTASVFGKKKKSQKTRRTCGKARKMKSASRNAQGDAKLSIRRSRYPWNSVACKKPKTKECSKRRKKKATLKMLKQVASQNKKQMKRKSRCV